MILTILAILLFFLLSLVDMAAATAAAAESEIPLVRGNLRQHQQRKQQQQQSWPYDEFVTLPLTLKIIVTPLPSFVNTMEANWVDTHAAQCLITAFEQASQSSPSTTGSSHLRNQHDANSSTGHSHHHHVTLSTIHVSHQVHGVITPFEYKPNRTSQDSHVDDLMMMNTATSSNDTAAATTNQPTISPITLLDYNTTVVDDTNDSDTGDNESYLSAITQFIHNLLHTLLVKLGLVQSENTSPPSNHNTTTTTNDDNNNTTASSSSSSLQPTTWTAPITHNLGGCLLCPSEDGDTAVETTTAESSTAGNGDPDSVPNNNEGLGSLRLDTDTSDDDDSVVGTVEDIIGDCGILCPQDVDDDDSEPRFDAEPDIAASTVVVDDNHNKKDLDDQASCGDLCANDGDDDYYYDGYDDDELVLTGVEERVGGGRRRRDRQLTAAPRGIWNIDALMETYLMDDDSSSSSSTTSTLPPNGNGQTILWNTFRGQTEIVEWADRFCDCFVEGVDDLTDDLTDSSSIGDGAMNDNQDRALPPSLCQLHISPEFD